MKDSFTSRLALHTSNIPEASQSDSNVETVNEEVAQSTDHENSRVCNDTTTAECSTTRKRKKSDLECELFDALSIWKDNCRNTSLDDEDETFGKSVSAQLRKLPFGIKAQAKLNIQKVSAFTLVLFYSRTSISRYMYFALILHYMYLNL